MKNLIGNLYGIEFEKEVLHNDEYFFFSGNKKYLLTTKYSEEYLNMLLNIKRNYNYFLFYDVLFNKYGSIFSEIENNKYILISLGDDYNLDVDFIDLINYGYLPNINLYNQIFNWPIKWEKRINDFKFVINDVNPRFYFVAMFYYMIADSCFEYLNNIILYNPNYQKSLNYKISHYRFKSNLTKECFYNPQNLLIDIKERDIAIFIQELFYSDSESYLDELEYYLKTSRVDQVGASLLFVRCIFPSKVFDHILRNPKDIDYDKFNINSYLDYIKKTYELINSYVGINEIVLL